MNRGQNKKLRDWTVRFDRNPVSRKPVFQMGLELLFHIRRKADKLRANHLVPAGNLAIGPWLDDLLNRMTGLV